MFEAIIYTWST